MKDIIAKARDLIEYERDVYVNTIMGLKCDKERKRELEDCSNEIFNLATEFIKACDECTSNE